MYKKEFSSLSEYITRIHDPSEAMLLRKILLAKNRLTVFGVFTLWMGEVLLLAFKLEKITAPPRFSARLEPRDDINKYK